MGHELSIKHKRELDILTIQNTPRIAPQTSAKKTVRPTEVAGSHSAKQMRPQTRVSTAAVLILEKRSLRIPISGRPTAVPRFKKPTISIAWLRESWIEVAKSEREKSKVMYPNMLIKAHSRSRMTSYRRRSVTSKASWVGLIWGFLSRMKIVAVIFATRVTSPVVRSAQARPIDRIMDAVPHVSITPPIPEPAEPMPLAKLRFCVNHCERIAMLGMIMKPMPQPTSNP